MNKVVQPVALMCCIIILCTSCRKSEERRCFKSNGKPLTENRSLGVFSKVELNDNINLTIIQDTVDKAAITAPSNLIGFISTDVSNNILTIKNNNKCNWLRSFETNISIVLHTQSLNNLTCHGSGMVQSQGRFTGDSFEINLHDASGKIHITTNLNKLYVKQHNGPAMVNISGESNNTEVYSAGSGFLYLQNLNSNQLTMRHKGTGDCHVRAQQYLHATLEYTGNIHVYGQAQEKYLFDKGEGVFFNH